ncbi:hypothetical protein KKF91_12530 [Myxococcota bacterium]|nr:hypothetical protein [Myxococcota bacterium]
MSNFYPLLLGFHEAVVGQGYYASVYVAGRVLAEVFEDGVWLYGVHPGAIAQSGDNVQEAAVNFRNTFRQLMADVAEDAPDFATFKAQMQQFFDDCDDETATAWDQAREEVRRNATTLDGLNAETAERKPSIRIREIKTSADRSHVALDQPPAIAA